MQRACDDRQVGRSAVGRRRNRLDQTGKQISRDPWKDGSDAYGTQAFHVGSRTSSCTPRRHCDVSPLNQLAKSRIESIARLGQIDLDLLDNLSGARREDEDAVAHEDGLFDIVGDQDDSLDGMRRSPQSSRKSVRSVSAVSTSSAENGSSMSRMFG